MRRAWVGAILLAIALTACDALSPRSHQSNETTVPRAGSHPTVSSPPPMGAPGRGINPIPAQTPPLPFAFADAGVDLGAPCDPSRSVASDSRALLVRDPEVLARFPLERVLTQIITTAYPASDDDAGRPSAPISALELLQRMFDTENTTALATFADAVHCDTPSNAAFANAPATDCPRAEAKLAKSTELLTADALDSFVPLALVNRFDLTPVDNQSCGEYQIVYAKRSGMTDPNDRVLLMLEATLENPARTLAACRPVTELWAGLANAESPAVAADRLEHFFFEGLGGFAPVVHAQHYSFSDRNSCDYTGRCGQVRLGQGMQSPWEFRQFRLAAPAVRLPSSPPLMFAPVTVSNSPPPEFFDPVTFTAHGLDFRIAFVNGQVRNLSTPEITRLQLSGLTAYEAGESAIDGPAQPNYPARIPDSPSGVEFVQEINQQLEYLQKTSTAPVCPADDPLTSDAILRRAAAVTCAGCHAPEHVLAGERNIGCAEVWPASLGQTHIDEQGRLSDALTQVFLPYRARVLSTYLQACDRQAIARNLQPAPNPNVHPECFAPGTAITMADGSEKAIEQITPGERVLSFDEQTHALVPGQVERAVVRRDADSVIAINGVLEATGNHPFYTARGEQRADRLELGDTLITLATRDLDPNHAAQLAAAPSEVRQLALHASSRATYNLEIAGHHNYFAGGLLVHDNP